MPEEGPQPSEKKSPSVVSSLRVRILGADLVARAFRYKEEPRQGAMVPLLSWSTRYLCIARGDVSPIRRHEVHAQSKELAKWDEYSTFLMHYGLLTSSRGFFDFVEQQRLWLGWFDLVQGVKVMKNSVLSQRILSLTWFDLVQGFQLGEHEVHAQSGELPKWDEYSIILMHYSSLTSSRCFLA